MSDVFGAVHSQQAGGDDDLLMVDDDLLTDDGAAPASPADQPAAPPVEETFAIPGVDGKEQQVPFKALTPKQVREWFDSHKNASDWRTKNTQEAQRIAKDREAYEADHKQHQTAIEQLERWTQFFRTNEPLQKLTAAYIQGKIPAERLAEILGERIAAQGVQVSGQPVAGVEDPRVATLQQRLMALEKSTQEERIAREQERIAGERAKAIEAALKQVPEEKQAEFKTYLEEVTKKMNDMPSLYSLVANAYMWDKNRAGLAQSVQQQTLADIQKKKGAKVDTGTGAPAVNLPQNVDTKGMSVSQLYELLGEQAGAYNE
jgi:hypothetical protein